MKPKNPESTSLWTKAPVANLVRYEPSGIYFARAKVRGKLIRKSLETNVLSIAKLRLADVLGTEHKALAASKTKIIGKMTFGSALAIFQERQKASTEIKERSKEYNERCAECLLKTWKGLKEADIKRITKHECLQWRAEFGGRYSPTVVNGTLSILRRVFDIALEAGARYDNPARSKEVRRARVRRKELRLPEPDQFLALVNEVRNSGGNHSKDCADAIEFFAYSGARLNEAGYICGVDCSFGKDTGAAEIVIRGNPDTGTKNSEIRRVPMIPEMRGLLERLKADHGDDNFRKNPVLRVRKFNRSLTRACKKLGLSHLTHHDLRHLFATRCIESGVDIPTVAKWLGHKDGGVLAMQTYGHLRDKHSADMAQKVVFGEQQCSAKGAAFANTKSNGEHSVPAANSNSSDAVPKAKAKYKYPWWASDNPAEVFWGQVNETVRIVPLDKFLTCAQQAMSRVVFKPELNDPEGLIDEFLARAPQLTVKALLVKIPRRRIAGRV